MYLLLSLLHERLSSGCSILDMYEDIRHIVAFFWEQERNVIPSTFSPLDLLSTRTKYAKGYISTVDVTNHP